MFRYFISAISQALGFSKVEARGTLVLIFVMMAAIVGSQLYIHELKLRSIPNDQEALSEWVQTVEASITIKPTVESFDKSVYLPTKTKVKTLGTTSSENKDPIKKEFPDEKEVVIRDLNIATAEELQQVKGIGPSYSERIIKYRAMLGGFNSMEQLTEVYGLQEETIEKLSKQFEIQSHVQHFDINNDSVKVLARHPYVSYDLAWIIINYRKQNGDIQSAEDLKKIKAVDEKTFNRLKPYLD